MNPKYVLSFRIQTFFNTKYYVSFSCNKTAKTACHLSKTFAQISQNCQHTSSHQTSITKAFHMSYNTCLRVAPKSRYTSKTRHLSKRVAVTDDKLWFCLLWELEVRVTGDNPIASLFSCGSVNGFLRRTRERPHPTTPYGTPHGNS